MSWQDLVCAHCGGRVAEAHCATCRSAREQFLTGRTPPGLAVGGALALTLFTVLLVLRLAGLA